MAIALWAAAAPGRGPCAWITLDDYDNRPGFLVLRRGRPAAGWRPGRPALPPWPAASRDHSSCSGSPPSGDPGPAGHLVLDDLHLVTEPATLDGLAYVLRNAAPGLRLIGASRMDPLLPLHRYRLAGELAEIRAGRPGLQRDRICPADGPARHRPAGSGLECLTGGPKAGRPGCGWPRSRWRGTPTRRNSPRNSRPRTVQSPATWSKRFWTPSPPPVQGPSPAHEHPEPGQRGHRRRAER